MDIYGLCSNCLRAREDVIPLAMTSPGERVRIVGWWGEGNRERRLAGMGLKRGTEVEVIKSGGPGPLIVASQETRIALGSSMAKKILVTTVGMPEKHEESVMALQRLNELRTGDRGIIERVTGMGRFRHRLMEMGFVPGTEVLVEKYAPLKDPIEYIVKGYHVSLRRKEAEKVLVRKLEEELRGD
jgi:Fur family ferric uptake transcriptional regulator